MRRTGSGVEGTARRNIVSDFGLLIPVVLALIVSIISFWALRYVIDRRDDAALNHAPDLIELQRLSISSAKMNNSCLGYLFTRRVWEKPALFKATQGAERQVLEELQRTRPLLPSSEGRAMVDQTERLLSDYFVHLNRVMRLSRSGASLARVSEAYDAEVAPRYLQLVETLGNLTRFKEAQLQKAGQASQRAGDMAMRLTLLSALIAIILGAILSTAYFRILGRVRSAESTLRETLQIREDFLSVASHELKNPVTALLLQIELLNRMMGSETATEPENRRNQWIVAERCLLETRRIVELVNDLMDLTRLRLGRLTLNRSEVDLGTVVREICEAHAAEAELHGSPIRMEINVPVSGCWDRMRISQVAFNLISNAVKYGDHKPIWVLVDHDPTHHRGRLMVQDQGIGMSSETQAKIFRRFERGVSDQKIHGLGLGLYIVRQIVEAHGGRVFVRSALGKGSTFIVELPYGEDRRSDEPKAA